MLAATFRSPFARTTISAVILAAVAALRGTTEVKVPPKDIIPATNHRGVDRRSRAVVGGAASQAWRHRQEQAGEPITAAAVAFAIATGGGTVGSPTGTTGRGGRRHDVDLGQTVDRRRQRAVTGLSTGHVPGDPPPSVSATALTKTAGDAQTAPITRTWPSSIGEGGDAFGNPIAGALVTFTIGSGGAS